MNFKFQIVYISQFSLFVLFWIQCPSWAQSKSPAAALTWRAGNVASAPSTVPQAGAPGASSVLVELRGALVLDAGTHWVEALRELQPGLPARLLIAPGRNGTWLRLDTDVVPGRGREGFHHSQFQI